MGIYKVYTVTVCGLELIIHLCLILSVEDFVSCNPEELAKKCSLSYKVCGMTCMWKMFFLFLCVTPIQASSLIYHYLSQGEYS